MNEDRSLEAEAQLQDQGLLHPKTILQVQEVLLHREEEEMPGLALEKDLEAGLKMEERPR